MEGQELIENNQVQELIIDYSACNDSSTSTDPSSPTTLSSNLYSSSFHGSNFTAGNPPSYYRIPNLNLPIGVNDHVVEDVAQCVIQFHIPVDLKPPVLFYYQLTNFYQNHRRYVKSLDTNQLLGNAVSNGSIKSGACDPLTTNSEGVAYYPCGLIANSVFNDTFTNPNLLNPNDGLNESVPYLMTNQSGISWDSDKSLYGKTKYTFDQVVPPPNWVERYNNNKYNSQDELPDLVNMEDFQVWMRTAGLPVFSKLYQRNDDQVMSSGYYNITINMRMCSFVSSCHPVTDIPF